MVQALPVLRLLKKHRPDSRVYWWIDHRLAPLLEGDRDLEGLVHFERQRWAHPKNWHELVRSIFWARDQKFDWVIDLQCLARSGAFAWLANGALTVGLDERREGARGFYDLIARRESYYTHAVDWYRAVLPLLGVPGDERFEWLPTRPAVATALRKRYPIGEGRWVALQPGARWQNKRWPVARYAELVKALRARHPDLRFAILGGQEDRELGAAITNPNGRPQECLDLTGRLSLPEMVEWIRASAIMVTNDTGPMHVAAAIGVPVIGLFGPTEPRRTGPYGQVQFTLQATALACVPCMKSTCHHRPHLECLETFPVERVVAAVERRLQ